MTAQLRHVGDRASPEAPVNEPRDFEFFFEANRRRLYGAFCLITGNQHEAEEIVQDAFLKVWERWERVVAMEDPVGFLFTTAMNLFRNRARRAAVAIRKPIVPSLRTDDLVVVEDRDELIRSMRPLTPRQRAALVLTGYLGYDAEEAARILGIEPSTVRSLSTKGRATIRDISGGRR